MSYTVGKLRVPAFHRAGGYRCSIGLKEGHFKCCAVFHQLEAMLGTCKCSNEWCSSALHFWQNVWRMLQQLPLDSIVFMFILVDLTLGGIPKSGTYCSACFDLSKFRKSAPICGNWSIKTNQTKGSGFWYPAQCHGHYHFLQYGFDNNRKDDRWQGHKKYTYATLATLGFQCTLSFRVFVWCQISKWYSIGPLAFNWYKYVNLGF